MHVLTMCIPTLRKTAVNTFSWNTKNKNVLGESIRMYKITNGQTIYTGTASEQLSMCTIAAYT